MEAMVATNGVLTFARPNQGYKRYFLKQTVEHYGRWGRMRHVAMLRMTGTFQSGGVNPSRRTWDRCR